MAETANSRTTRRAVLVTFAVDGAETLGLGVAAWVTGSVAVRAQTAASAADLAVQVFLLIGVYRSVRPPDDTHPLGYGREGFFWSLFAALGIFVGGGVLGIDQAVRSALHPTAVQSYPIAYLMLVTTVTLDAFALEVALRPVRKQAAGRGVALRYYLLRNTDPASTTNVVGGGCAVIGGVAAVGGLGLTQATGSAVPDIVAGALIGLLLLFGSVLLLRTNQELISGRGVPPAMTSEMSGVITAQPGVVDVPDLFAVVIGPSSLIVDGDVTFADDLDLQAVEKTITRCTAALTQRWPAIEYVYLTPVSKPRPRRVVRAVDGKEPRPDIQPGSKSSTDA
ncbi:MAG TPA: cation diffusion facilitator family transporter [Streptosporangiaceae bacterium]|nr:cation diffusion facilitator family transporter [Streptosporangiaceae bacterium]